MCIGNPREFPGNSWNPRPGPSNPAPGANGIYIFQQMSMVRAMMNCSRDIARDCNVTTKNETQNVVDCQEILEQAE